MLHDFIQSQLADNLGFPPTPSQAVAQEAFARFLTSQGKRDVMILTGYAGTGKTTMIKAAVRVLGLLQLRCQLLAPTGRAAKVISSYSGLPAYTIHKQIYRMRQNSDGIGRFELAPNLFSNTVFIVDEASMITDSSQDASVFGTGRLLDDLFTYCYNGRNCKLIFVGDTAQLPPVGFCDSPALNPEYLQHSYGADVISSQLTDVVRQQKESGILHNATHLRELINQQASGFPQLKADGFEDVIHIGGTELIEAIGDEYRRCGQQGVMIISRSNKRANKFNAGIRNSILWREEEFSFGDTIMVVKNNYYDLDENSEIPFIANGDIGEILRIGKRQEMYGYRFADIQLRLTDYKDIELDRKILLDTLMMDTPSLGRDESKEFYFKVAEDYQHITSKKKRYEAMRKDPYLNAIQAKFAYAVTCHKAQGGQWPCIFVDVGFITDEMLNTEFYRWLYTAITRAQERLYLVNFKEEFFVK